MNFWACFKFILCVFLLTVLVSLFLSAWQSSTSHAPYTGIFRSSQGYWVSLQYWLLYVLPESEAVVWSVAVQHNGWLPNYELHYRFGLFVYSFNRSLINDNEPLSASNSPLLATVSLQENGTHFLYSFLNNMHKAEACLCSI